MAKKVRLRLVPIYMVKVRLQAQFWNGVILLAKQFYLIKYQSNKVMKIIIRILTLWSFQSMWKLTQMFFQKYKKINPKVL